MEGENIAFNLPAYAGEPLQVSDKTEMAISPFRTLRESKIIVIKPVSPTSLPTVYVRINGNISGSFEKGELKIAVYNGDYLEIDATELQEPAVFILKVPNSGLRFPEDGALIQTNKDLTAVGIVKFR